MLCCTHLELVRGLEVVESNLAALRHRLFTLTHPDTRVVLLLVRLVSTLRVANLRHKVVLLVQDKVTDTLKVGVLRVGVNVHLHNAIDDGRRNLLLLRT